MVVVKFSTYSGARSSTNRDGDAHDNSFEPSETYGKAIDEVPGPGAQRNSRSRKRLSPAAVIARSLAPDATHLSPTDIIARSVENAFGHFPVPQQQHRPTHPTHSPFSAPIERTHGIDNADPFNVFWSVWMEHQDYLLKQSVRFMSGNIADAEDALSQAMLKGSQHFNGNEIRNERAWLTRLVHNACMDQHRSRKRQQRLCEESIGDDPEETPTLQPQPQRTPDEALHMNQLFTALENHLKELPVSLLEPLMLRVIEEKSYDEIAACMGLSNCAVRKRIQLARDRLRQAGLI